LDFIEFQKEIFCNKFPFTFNNRNVTYKRFGIHMAFVATRSGLLRFSDHSHLFKDPNENPDVEHDDIKEP